MTTNRQQAINGAHILGQLDEHLRREYLGEDARYQDVDEWPGALVKAAAEFIAELIHDEEPPTPELDWPHPVIGDTISDRYQVAAMPIRKLIAQTNEGQRAIETALRHGFALTNERYNAGVGDHMEQLQHDVDEYLLRVRNQS